MSKNIPLKVMLWCHYLFIIFPIAEKQSDNNNHTGTDTHGCS